MKFWKEERFNYPSGPLPDGYLFKLFAFRHLDRGRNEPSSSKLLERNWDDNIRHYIKEKRIEEILEPILISLLIGGLENHSARDFVLEKLTHIQNVGLDAVTWKTFIPVHLVPEKRSIAVKYSDEIDRIDGLDPCDEIYYIKAFNFRYKKLKRTLFELWTKYVERKKLNRRIKAEKLAKAKAHRERNIKRTAWTVWIARCQEQRERNHKASLILAKMYCLRFAKTYIRAWRKYTEEALKTRRYFEQIERGEIEDYNALMANKDADAIYRLPRAIAIKIFSYLNIEELSICRAVSREWNIMTQSPSLWAKIDYSVCRHQVSDYAAAKHSQISRLYLSRLNLSGTCLELSTYKAFASCRNVQQLNLSNSVYLSDDHVQTITERMPALLALDLSHTNITDASLRFISKTGVNIQFLRLAYCTKFTSHGLYYLGTGEGCRLLRSVDLSGCLQIPSNGFKSLANGCLYLKSLHLNNLYSLEDVAVDNFLRKARGLEELSLKNCGGLTSRAFKELRSHTTLRKLSVSLNYKIDDAILLSSLKMCSHFTDLNLVDCIMIGDGTLKALAPLRHLKRVNISMCTKVSDLGMRFLIDGCSGPSIISLNLSYLDKLTDITLFRMSQRCAKLRLLVVNFCDRLTDSGFELIPKLPNLREFHCRGCFISNLGAALIGRMKTIRILNFSECQRIRDWEKVTKQFNPEMISVDFSIVQGVTNTGIKHMAFNCRYLERINISGCPNLTDLSVQYISGVCHYLNTIDISGLPHISDRSIKYLRKGCKQLAQLDMLYMSSITKEGFEKASKWFQKVEWSQDDVPDWWEDSYARADKFLAEDSIAVLTPRMTLEKSGLGSNFFQKSSHIPRVTSLRPNTALGVSFEKEQKKKVPPLQRKFQTRHTFDGVTINILYNGPKGDNNGKKGTNGNGDKYSPRPRSSQASRTSQGSSQGKRRDSVSRSRSSKSAQQSRPSTAKIPRVTSAKLPRINRTRPDTAHPTKS